MKLEFLTYYRSVLDSAFLKEI